MIKKTSLAVIGSLLSLTSFSQFWNVSEPVRLGGSVNSEAEESIPVFSKDSSKLYFVRTYDANNHGGETDQDIWVSTRDANGGYSDCERVKKLNNKFNNAIQGMGANGTTMFLLNAYDGKKDVIKGLTQVKSEAGGWSSPSKINIPNLDIEGEYYGFHVAKNAIIISHQGVNSLGAEDLYVSTRKGSGWSAPVHMGNVVNTTGFEISPFLSDNGDTLFFSSDGHGGYGDADIFYSVKQGGWDQWSKPKNLGDVINSPKFDAYFTHSGTQAYWSSNRDGELSDIYMVTLLTPPALFASATGTDVTVFEGTDGRIDLTPEGGVPPYAYAWSNGMKIEDPQNVPKGEYTVVVTDYIGQIAEVVVPISEPGPPLISKLDFKHFFGYNKNKLNDDRAKLDEFLSAVEGQVAKSSGIVEVKITSSASNVPTRTFRTNDRLAKTRADNMATLLTDHFKAKGISDKVKVEIISVIVGGPNYEKDAQKESKYGPFQFVELSSE
jgi:hypothetical protein